MEKSISWKMQEKAYELYEGWISNINQVFYPGKGWEEVDIEFIGDNLEDLIENGAEAFNVTVNENYSRDGEFYWPVGKPDFYLKEFV